MCLAIWRIVCKRPRFRFLQFVFIAHVSFLHFRIVAKTTKDIFGLEMVSLHGMPTASQVLQGCGVNWVSFPYFISIFYFLSCVGSIHSLEAALVPVLKTLELQVFQKHGNFYCFRGVIGYFIWVTWFWMPCAMQFEVCRHFSKRHCANVKMAANFKSFGAKHSK